MSNLPDEWAVVPVFLAWDVELQSQEFQNGIVVIYSEESGGEWIQSDTALEL